MVSGSDTEEPVLPDMLTYALKRTALTLPLLVGVVLLTFLLMDIIPGNPISAMLVQKHDPEVVARLMERYGLNDPAPVRFWRYLTGILRGDLGLSLSQNRPVADILADVFPNTCKLALSATLLTCLFGISAGVWSALHGETVSDRAVTAFAVFGISTPTFCCAVLLQYLLAYRLKWFPVSGFSGPEHLILPSLVLGWYGAGSVVRLVRSSMLDALNADFIRTAQMKGLKRARIVFRHALKNALPPVVTLLAMQSASLFGGAVITESLFSIPGLGSLSLNALVSRDMPLLQGAILLSTLVVILGNLAADLLCAAIDPRLRR